jgi:hypothetical protein
MLNTIILNVVMLFSATHDVAMLNVIELNVVAPHLSHRQIIDV